MGLPFCGSVAQGAVLAAAVMLFGALGGSASAEPIRGAGSTFAAPVIAEWSRDYEAARADGGDYVSPDWKVDYELVGSLGGIMRLDQPELDFAATDVPLSHAELVKRGRQQFPIVMGAIAVVANVEGVAPGALKLSGPVLADIYLGRIRSWSDPKIKAINPDLDLQDLRIMVMHRQDGSGSTYALTRYLAASSPEWKSKYGADTLVSWPLGTSQKGTAALLGAVAATDGAIGYADFGQTERARLAFALMENGAGKFVAPGPAGVEAAADTVVWSGAESFFASLADGAGDAAYPLSVTTFAVVPVAGRVPERVGRVRDLFRVAFAQGAADARALGYVPLPPALVAEIETYWSAGP